eukprot:gene20097-22067_t
MDHFDEDESASDSDCSENEEIEGSNEEREEDIRKELADVPFEDLEKLRERVSTSEYTAAVFGSTGIKKRNAPSSEAEEKERETSELFAENRKKHDSRPMEMSSKKRVSRFRRVVMAKGKATRDPRFDDLSGNLNEELFKKSYGFLEGMKKKEKKAIQQQMKKEKNLEKKAALRKLLQRMEQQETREKQAEERRVREHEIKKKEMEAVQQGKKPFYMKKSEKKKLELVEKYKHLKESGKLEKYLSKKRKRNAAKDRRNLPWKRQQNT